MLSAPAVFLPQPADGAVDWTLKKQIAIEGVPLDMVSDGGTVYILVPGKVLLYSVAENRVVDFVPVDGNLDKLTYSPKEHLFLLASSKEKLVKVFQMEKKARVDLAGLPVLGPAGAPVTIAVYSDYQ